MTDEIKSFIRVWFTVTTSLCYCYYLAIKIPKGKFRLLSILPVFYLFTTLPFNLSSFHLGVPTTVFLVWLGNFKLLLFSFDLGPLSSHPPKPLPHFISVGCLPIKIKQNPSLKSPQNTTSNSKLLQSVLFAIKVVLLVIIISTYQYKQFLHPNMVLTLYCIHMYLGVEIALAICAAPVRTVLGLEIERQFNEPYLSTSLQDFWGRRWNLMVTSILRPTVYDPIRRISVRTLGRQVSLVVSVLATFLVSGIMHEVIYFYLTRASPTWEVTWFFVLHGVCTAVEIGLKKALGDRLRLHRMVSGPLTVGFVAVTAVWLFYPQMKRNGVDEKAIMEYSVLVDFVTHFFVKVSD